MNPAIETLTRSFISELEAIAERRAREAALGALTALGGPPVARAKRAYKRGPAWFARFGKKRGGR